MKKSTYIADSLLRRGQMEFLIPASLHNSEGYIRKCIVKLINEATRENIEKLERLGVRCSLNVAC